MQLRELFGDPLLVRDGNRLLPTPKAEAMMPRLAELLCGCEALLVGDAFSPSHWKGPMVMASSDYVAQYIFPDIVALMESEAPCLALQYRLWSPELLPQLADSDIQLFSTMLPAIPDGVCGAAIGRDSPVCVMRQDHPLAGRTVSLEDFVAYGHIRVSAGGDKDSFVDRELQALGMARRIQVSVPFFNAAFQSLCRTDMLMVLPEHIARNMASFFPITHTSLPLPVPEHRYWLLWHPRFDIDPAHSWFRQQVLSVMRQSMYSIQPACI
nr:LysR substrate-binding domain-containing protein [Photobacterium aquae]